MRLNGLHDPNPKRRRICIFIDGRLLTGHASGHRTKHARRWRTVIRIMHRLKTTWP